MLGKVQRGGEVKGIADRHSCNSSIVEDNCSKQIRPDGPGEALCHVRKASLLSQQSLWVIAHADKTSSGLCRVCSTVPTLAIVVPVLTIAAIQ